MSNAPKIAILIPCYKRPEYTEICLQSVIDAQKYGENVTFFLVDDGSADGTHHILKRATAKIPSEIDIKLENIGLRNVIIEFFEKILADGTFDYITKIDNDCTVPQNWLNDLTRIFETANADIISPNTSETNAAHKYGKLNCREGEFIPSAIVGGLWFMKVEMIRDIFFERFNSRGIRAAFHLINQIIIEKSPKIGWTDSVTFGDVGFWAGSHPSHIKSLDHAMYSAEVGRRIAWNPGKEAPVVNIPLR